MDAPPADAPPVDATTGDLGESRDASEVGDASPGRDAGTGPVSCAHPVVLTNTVGQFFSDMVVDDHFVYWYEPLRTFADGGTGVRVARVPVDGSGPAVDLFAAYCGGIQGEFAADADNIYIGCRQPVDATRNVQIMRIPKSGAAPSPLFISDVSVPSLNLGVGTIGADGTNVYFSCCNSTGLYSIPPGGGSPTRLTPDPQPPIVNGFMYITGFGGNVYWHGSYIRGGSLLQLPATGGTPTLLADDVALYGQIDNISIRDSNFYWRSVTPPAPQALWRMPLSGGAPTRLATTLGGSTGGQLAVFGDYIYFAEHDSSDLIVESYPLHPVVAGDAGDADAAGTPTVLARIPVAPGFRYSPQNHVVANSTHLFISDPGQFDAGHIYRCE